MDIHHLSVEHVACQVQRKNIRQGIRAYTKLNDRISVNYVTDRLDSSQLLMRTMNRVRANRKRQTVTVVTPTDIAVTILQVANR